METLLSPVQHFPVLIREQQVKHPKFTFWLMVGMFIVLAFAFLHFFTIEQTKVLQNKNDALSLDVANLKLFQSQQARILQLEQALLSNKQIRARIGQDNIASFSFKILSLADQYQDDGVTAALLLGLIEIESGFTPTIVSETKAYGLMQIVRSTAIPYLRAKNREWSEAVMFDPNINVQIGTELLVDLHRMYINRGLEKKTDFTFSLSAYNMGEKPVQDAVNRKDKIYLNYVASVRMAEKKWIALGM